jgi:hypothetical protein
MMDDTNKGRSITVALMLIAALFMGMVGVSYFRIYGTKEKTVHADADSYLVKQWLNAVQTGQREKAIAIAKRFLPDYKVVLPELDYLRIFKGNDISSAFLTDDLNDVDYSRWRDVLLFKRIANSIKQSSMRILEQALSTVLKKIKYKKVKSGTFPPLSLTEIWQHGEGNNVDRLRVFIELVKQLGYRVKVIALPNPETGRYMHLLVELEKDGQFHCVDLHSGYLWKGHSGRKLAAKPELLPKQWPDLFKKMIQRAVVLIPVEVQDYRRINNLLYQRLLRNAAKSDDIPVFGLKAKEELDRYVTNYGNNCNRLGYWQIPIIALHSAKKKCPMLWFYSNSEKKK